MALQQRMTNNAYYAHALEHAQSVGEALNKERESEVLAKWRQIPFERGSGRGAGAAAAGGEC